MGDVHFRGGVFSTAGNQSFVFIDPQSLDRSDRYGAANLQLVRDAIDNSLEPAGRATSDAQIRAFIDAALDSAPAARGVRVNLKGVDPSITQDEIVDVCVVFKQDFYSDTRQELAGISSGIRPGRLKPVPGTDAVWDQAVGAHEGRHCVQRSTSTALKDVITRETGADLEAIKWLKDNGHKDVAAAYIDYRLLSEVHSTSPDHATGLALAGKGLADITDDYVKASQQMRTKILTAVSNEHELGSERNALRMVEYNPGRFIRTVERALARGEFRGGDASPDLETHVKAYIEAFRRQVDGITPPVPSTPKVSGASASIDLESGGSATMTIGGVAPAAFFASLADPALFTSAVAHNDADLSEPVQTDGGDLAVRPVTARVAVA